MLDLLNELVGHGPLRTALLAGYFALLAALAAFGAHRWFLLTLYWRHRRREPRAPEPLDPLPRVTVQLPIFNELYVVERLIDAVCRLDYPRERLEIQVLDDSTDETRELTARRVEARRAEGYDIVHLHRVDRTGFKAGALDAGMREAGGELIAVFDADFEPDPAFLKRLVHRFADPEVGMVQARWGHLNAGHSTLTRVQSMMLDGHFIIEHTARNRSGRFFNFNGTAGIWRRRCIEQAGGWQHDTLTEDLDLSYRAQLRGWRFVYDAGHIAPAELPVEMSAFKSQQFRWAKGSIQTARKMLGPLLRSEQPWWVKLEGVVHLGANMGYLLMVLLALLVVPAVFLRAEMAPWVVAAFDLPVFLLATGSVASFYLVARRETSGSWWQAAREIPLLMVVGIGLSINNARAVWEALIGKPSGFKRTPKYNLAHGATLAARRYRGRINRDTWIELGFALYFLVGTLGAAADGLWGALPFLLLFEAGFAYSAIVTIVQASQRARLADRTA